MIEKKPVTKVRIDFQDCDPFGHLNNTRYLNYMMKARADHLREYYKLDIYEHTKETKNSWIVSKNKIAYLQPVMFNNNVLIESQLIYNDKHRVVVQCTMFSESKSNIHSVFWAEFIYINTETGRPKKHEDDIQELLTNINIKNEGDNKLEDLDFDKAVKEITLESRKNKK